MSHTKYADKDFNPAPDFKADYKKIAEMRNKQAAIHASKGRGPQADADEGTAASGETVTAAKPTVKGKRGRKPAIKPTDAP